MTHSEERLALGIKDINRYTAFRKKIRNAVYAVRQLSVYFAMVGSCYSASTSPGRQKAVR